MYCPRCGQSQNSSDVQFCSRCGMSLRIVKDLVRGDGIALKQSELGVTGVRRWNCQKGMRLGAKLVFWGLAFVPPTLGFSLVTNTPPFFFLVSLMIVLAGICRMFYARLFEESDSPKQAQQIILMQNHAFTNSPEARATTNSLGAPGVVTPHSVTEHTTKLLEG